MHREKVLSTPYKKQRQLLWPLNNLEKGSFRNRENLQYKKTAASILLRLFMRTNGKTLQTVWTQIKRQALSEPILFHTLIVFLKVVVDITYKRKNSSFDPNAVLLKYAVQTPMR